MARWTERTVGKGRAALTGLCLLAAPFALGGCVDKTADNAPTPEAHQQFARREGVSIAQASVAIVSVEGAPAAVAGRFRQTLEQEARSHDIVIAESSKARYLVRGYLSAELTTDGASFEYVWDVFTADKRRAQRLNDVIDAPGSGDDPWAMASDAVLASIAGKSADDLAAYLSNTPEAVAETDGAAPKLASSPAKQAAPREAPATQRVATAPTSGALAQ